MPPRKRRISSNSVTPKKSTKRARISSLDAHKQDEAVDQVAFVPGGSQGEYFKVRDILQEKPGQYLIDWEDHPVTGEKYTPTWEPRRNANEEAVAAWKRKKKEKRSSAPRARRRLSSSSSAAVIRITQDRSVTPLTPAERQTIESSPLRTQETGFAQEAEPSQEVAEVGDSQLPPLPVVDKATITVQISPHSSLDRDRYIQYISSFSAQGVSSSQQERLDSGLGDSSPPHPFSIQTNFITNGVVPDSQSLPDSSSYVLTASTSGTGSGASQLETTYRSKSPWPPNASLANRSSSLLLAESSDPIEDPPSPLVVLNWKEEDHIQRSKSVPLQSSGDTSPASRARASRQLQTVRSNSDPALLILGNQDKRSPGTGSVSKASTADISAQSLRPSRSGSKVQGFSTLPKVNTISTRVDIPASDQNRSITSQIPCNIPSEEHLVLQTQNSFAAESQDAGCTRASTPSAGEILQNAQLVPKPAISVSEVSSENLQETPTKSVQIEGTDAESASLEPVVDLANTVDTFTHSRDQKEHSLSLEVEHSSVLSPRDPNSQPEKLLQSAQSKEDIALASVEPADFTIGEVCSSSLPPVPSQLPEISFNDALLRPSTSTDIMSDASQLVTRTSPRVSRPMATFNPPEGMSLREKLRNMRAASAATAAARRATRALSSSASARVSKSPSLIPEPHRHEAVGESRLEVQTVDVPLVTRISQQGPHTPTHPSKLSMHKEMSQTQTLTTLEPPKLGRMEFVVPLPLPAGGRDQYSKTVNFYRHTIENFTRTGTSDTATLKQLKAMIDSVDNVSTHSDLEDPSTATEQGVPPEDQVIWSSSCSAKFNFLQHLIDVMRHQAHHIAIVSREGRLLDIIETFLKGMHVHYERPDTLSASDSSRTRGRVHISLIASGDEGSSALPSAANLVVAFDASFDAKEPQIASLRDHMLNVGQLSPVIHLLVYSSAEHIKRCLPKSIMGVDRLRLIVSWVASTRRGVGELLEDEAGPQAAAEEVAAFIEAGGSEDQWTLPAIRSIECVDSSQDLELDSTTESDTQTSKEQSAGPILKRPLDASEERAATSKRPRVTPAPEVTHISDSVTQGSDVPSQPIAELRNALQQAQGELATDRNAYNIREASLQSTISTTQQQLQEHVDALSSLQRRYESRTRAYHTLRHEKADLIAAAAIASSKSEAQASEIVSLKEGREAIESELKEAKEAVTNSTIPEISQFESAKAEAKKLAAENALLQRRVESMAKDFEFTRQQYQIASNSAFESASRLTELESEIATLRQQASGEAARLRSMNDRSEVELHLKRIEELEALLEDREELLRKKERGRGVTTRAASVQPRSPRMGGSRQGSRAASPMPGAFLGVAGGVGGQGRGGSGLRFG